jgi:hypothetical protein
MQARVIYRSSSGINKAGNAVANECAGHQALTPRDSPMVLGRI